MIRRYAGLVVIGIALGATPAAAQNVDSLIAARGNDQALKQCLDNSASVRAYRSDALWAKWAAARDPKAAAKFNCGMGASWQEVAPKACCVAFDRTRDWHELQMCGWRDYLPKSRAAYERAARECLAKAPAPPRQAQVPLTPPPLMPSAPPQQAQVPLTPPPPIPPAPPVQEALVPRGDAFGAEAAERLIKSVAGNPACARTLSPKSGKAAMVSDGAGGFRLRRGDSDQVLKPAGRRSGRALPLLTFPGLLDAGLRSMDIASSEHATIRGTINGGGDFVKAEQDPGYRRNACMVADSGKITMNQPGSTLHASADHTTIRGTINGGGDFIYDIDTWMRLSNTPPLIREIIAPDVVITLYGTALHVDVAKNGVVGVGVLDGRVEVQDTVSGTFRASGADTVMVAVPGRGVSTPIPMPAALADEARAYLAASGPQTAQAPPEIRLSDATPARGVKDGRPVGPGATFTPDVNPIYVWFRLEGVTAATKLRQVWHYLGAGADRTIGEGDFTAPAGAKWADVKFTLAEGKRWPLGEYRVEIFSGDRRLLAVPFRVSDEKAQPRIVEARPVRGVKDGMPVEPDATFKPEAEAVQVWFRITGVNVPTKLHAELNYIGRSGDHFLHEDDFEVQPGTDWGRFQFEKPVDFMWPVGEYRMDIAISGAAAASVPLRVVGVPRPTITASRTARDVRDGLPVGIADVFAPDSGPIYLWLRLGGHDKPFNLRSVWHYLGGGKDREFSTFELVVRENQDWAALDVELTKGKPWPLGEYRVDVFIDGKLVQSRRFQVAGAPALPKIAEAKPARGVKDGKPVDPGAVFAPDANPIYVWFRVESGKVEATLRAVWRYLGEGGDRVIGEGDLKLPPDATWGDFQYQLAAGKRWPVGDYRVEILMGDQQIASVPFRVEAAAPKLTVSDAQVARGVKDGKPVDPGAVFAPDASPLYVWFRVAGNTAPVKMRGEWHYLGGGGDRIIGKTEGELRVGATTANFRRTLAEGKTWLAGDYRVDVFADDALAASVRFRIEEGKPTAAAAPAAGAITLASVEALLRELGADPQRRTRQDGVPYFEFTMDGRKTALGLYGCTPGPCAQALLYSGFRTGKTTDAQAINEWNRKNRFLRAYIDDEGDPVVESDLVLTGAQAATLREWIAEWRRRVPQFLAHLKI
jgi:hypothetical protein